MLDQSSGSTGLSISGEARAMALLTRADGSPLILVSRYGQPLLAFVQNSPKPGTSMEANPDERMAISYQAGKVVKQQEFFYGSGYLSQSSRNLWIPQDIDSVQLVSFSGKKRTVKPKD